MVFVMTKLEDLTLNTLISLYTIVSDIFGNYAKFTDNYSLSTGDKLFENMPKDILELTNTRQRFFGYKLKIMDAIKNKIDKAFETNEFEE